MSDCSFLKFYLLGVETEEALKLKFFLLCFLLVPEVLAARGTAIWSSCASVVELGKFLRDRVECNMGFSNGIDAILK